MAEQMKMDDNVFDLLNDGLSDSSFILKEYQCEKYIFEQKYNRAEVKRNILASHRLRDAIDKHCSETGIGRNEAIKKSGDIVDEIAHTFDIKMIRFLGYALRKILKRLFQHVYINRDGLKKVNMPSFTRDP